jgi:asparagine synthase (glutamine-hydrolysing)
MCGILVTSGAQRPFHHRLLNGLRKRGPDSIGFWSDGRTNMAHTRLAIVGLDERGIEPLENDTHVLAYNGEIYNFLDLSRRLASEGARITFANDAETLLEGWSRWGPKILGDMTGLWAFCVYDKAKKKLFLVRDQLGIKPLYYWKMQDGLVVSSLLGTLLKAAGQTPELDHQAMSEYVRYQFTFGDKTFFKPIKKVLPGHIVEYDVETGSIVPRAYEDIFSHSGEGTERATPEWLERTRSLLAECCVDSTISDTSFTTFCSGGLDSSVITRLTGPEIAYHCNYSDPECNETFYAQQVVDGTDIRLFVVNAQEEFNLVDRLRNIVEDFDELTIGSVILPLDDLLTQVKRRYKVILTGTGGDELFAGYVRYQLAMGQCFHDSYRALFAKMHAVAAPAERFELAHRKGDPSFYKFYEPQVANTFYEAYSACGPDGDEMRRMLTFDRRYFLAGLLNIDDKMCGRHSLEGRPSLLHQRFVRHIQRLDSADMLIGDELKYVGKQLVSGTLPKSVIHRKDKMGFTTPIGTFVNRSSHLVREQLTASRFRDLYDLRKMNLTAETKFSREVFGLLMLDLWLNRYATSVGALA